MSPPALSGPQRKRAERLRFLRRELSRNVKILFGMFAELVVSKVDSTVLKTLEGGNFEKSGIHIHLRPGLIVLDSFGAVSRTCLNGVSTTRRGVHSYLKPHNSS